MNKIPMTVGGHKALDEELKRLKTEERPAVIAAISEAREHGDLSENAEYHAAKERQGQIEASIVRPTRVRVPEVLAFRTVRRGACSRTPSRWRPTMSAPMMHYCVNSRRAWWTPSS